MNARRRPHYRELEQIIAAVSDAETWILACSIMLLLAALVALPGDALTLEGNFSSPPAAAGLHLK
jgi:hypothetical protein